VDQFERKNTTTAILVSVSEERTETRGNYSR